MIVQLAKVEGHLIEMLFEVKNGFEYYVTVDGGNRVDFNYPSDALKYFNDLTK